MGRECGILDLRMGGCRVQWLELGQHPGQHLIILIYFFTRLSDLLNIWKVVELRFEPNSNS